MDPARLAPIPKEFNRRERKELKENRAVGQTGASTLRVKTIPFPSSFFAFFVLFAVGQLRFLG
jgi:hypothetical protein